jgi:hypothetical protein
MYVGEIEMFQRREEKWWLFASRGRRPKRGCEFYAYFQNTKTKWIGMKCEWQQK